MTKEDLAIAVNQIIAKGVRDPETAHSDEDELHLQLIGTFCPDWAVDEIHRLEAADFPRWYA